MTWFSKYDCRYCRDTGMLTVRQKLNVSEVSARIRGEQLAIGGYVAREVEIPCDHTGTQPEWIEPNPVDIDGPVV